MRNECRVCLTDNTLEEKFRDRGAFAEPANLVLECGECKAVAIWSWVTKELRWYSLSGVVSRVWTLDSIARLQNKEKGDR